MTCGGTRAYGRGMPDQRSLQVVAAALVLAALAWVDPIYLLLITLGPIVAGVVAGARGVEPRLVAATWFLAGLLVLVTDLVVNGEDVAFHAVVAVFTAALGAAAAAVGRRLWGSAAPGERGERPGRRLAGAVGSQKP